MQSRLAERSKHKGDIVSAFAVMKPSREFGVYTEWVVRLSFQSPTGDSSDFLHRDLPCLNKEQAEQIAKRYNTALDLDNNR